MGSNLSDHCACRCPEASNGVIPSADIIQTTKADTYYRVSVIVIYLYFQIQCGVVISKSVLYQIPTINTLQLAHKFEISGVSVCKYFDSETEVQNAISYHIGPTLYVYSQKMTKVLLANGASQNGALINCGLWLNMVTYIWVNKNIERHTVHTIVSWPNPKQWIIVHTSDLMMIIRPSIYILSITMREMGQLKTLLLR